MNEKPTVKEDREEGTFERDVYTEKGREELVDNDEITDVEEGFVQGYEEGDKQTKCGTCKKILVDENFVEKEIDGDIVRFCSDECAEEYKK